MNMLLLVHIPAHYATVLYSRTIPYDIFARNGDTMHLYVIPTLLYRVAASDSYFHYDRAWTGHELKTKVLFNFKLSNYTTTVKDYPGFHFTACIHHTI